MPTIPVPSRTYAAGERFVTQSVTVPPIVTEARVTLNLTTAQLQNPATNVQGIIEWAPAGSTAWRELASTTLVGKPANRAGLLPTIQITPAAMQQLQGHLVRGVVWNKAATTITFDGTVVFT